MIQLYNTNDATTEPVTPAELKSQLRITGTDFDTILAQKIQSARQRAEEMTLRYLRVGATAKAAIFRYYLDDFPRDGTRKIKIYQCPVVSIIDIHYYDATGVLQELSSSYYNTDTISEPARIAEAYGYSWPSIQERINAVYIEFQSGYQLAANIPPMLKEGILMLAAHFFENPSDVMTGTQVNEIPESSKELFMQFRLNRL